ncbi:MAG: cytochrome c family protein [Candidatus Magnetominusculus sp. LBB02]|nr:cytochrome c family protein [Candidatus Magnetominusculus sp. LBB02]
MAFILIALLLLPAAARAHEVPDGAAPYEKSRRCSACHPAVYKEWQTSMHSMSSTHKDPAHSAMFGAFLDDMKAAGKDGGYNCVTCHMPMADNIKALMEGTERPNAELWKEDEGIGCAFCHRVEEVVEGKDRNLFKINKDGSYVASGMAQRAPHGVGANPLFTGGQMCMGCHSHLENQSGVAICSMKEEGQGNCLSCHMESKEGPPSIESEKETHASHEMGGGHSLAMLAKAVKVNAAVKKTQGVSIVEIEVTNMASHAFPSTMPMRMAWLKLTGFDAAKNAVFANYKETPLEDKNALFMKAFKGAKDEIGVPAWKAEAVAFDTRLKGSEMRKFSYPIDNDAVKYVTVEVIYRLFSPGALKRYPLLKKAVDADKNIAIYKKEFTIQ